MNDKVTMNGYGVRLTFAENTDIDRTDADEHMKNAPGFIGYDDKGSSRYYFYISGKNRDDAALSLLNGAPASMACLITPAELAVLRLQFPVEFTFTDDWLKDSAEEIRSR